jgi:oligopeptidase B
MQTPAPAPSHTAKPTASSTAVSAANSTAPVARREPKQTPLHGTVLVDDYAWLREKESPEVTAYLEAENAYAEAVMAPLAGLRDELYQEMLSHIKQTDISVPYRDGSWWYYSRTEEGLQYPVYCRKADVPDATEEVILDGNALAEGHAVYGYRRYGRYRRWPLAGLQRRPHGLSPIHAAYQGSNLWRGARRNGRAGWLDCLGGRRNGRHFSTPWRTKSRSGSISSGGTNWVRHIRPTYWSSKSPTSDSTWRRPHPGRQVLGHGSRQPHHFGIAFSGRRYSCRRWTLVAEREDEHEYSIDHRNGLWFIRTNDQGRNFRLVTAPVATPGREHLDELSGASPGVMLEEIDLFERFFVACEREDGLPRLQVLDFTENDRAIQSHEIRFPEPVYSAFPAYQPRVRCNKISLCLPVAGNSQLGL